MPGEALKHRLRGFRCMAVVEISIFEEVLVSIRDPIFACPVTHY